nr:phosphotransferase [Streptomyces sp. Xyl84]
MTLAPAEAGPRQDLAPLLPLLGPWLRTRRWYAAGPAPAGALTPVVVNVVREQAPALVHTVLRTQDGQLYQLLLGLRPDLPRRLAGAAIGQVPDGDRRGWTLYEATEDAALMGVLLRHLAQGTDGGLRLQRATRMPLPVGLVPRPLTADQSNSAVVYGDRLLLKIYRRPEPGPHLEVETLRALTEARCARTPRLHGTLLGGPTGLVLGLMEDLLPAEGDGWQAAVRQVTDCVDGTCPTVPATGGFTAHARALGAAVAELHTALADVFPRVLLTPDDIARQAAEMTARLDRAMREVPALARHRAPITRLYDDYARAGARGCPVLAQRVHGDLHLGQALPTPSGWRLIDFEGEPARPAAERAAPQPVLRDLAGMLRSFDYAAQAGLRALRARDPDDAPGPRLRRARRARAWALRNRRAFLAGYADAGGTDPHCHPLRLRAFEADKAVYEAVYEHRHRPDWLPIPLEAVHRLART